MNYKKSQIPNPKSEILLVCTGRRRNFRFKTRLDPSAGSAGDVVNRFESGIFQDARAEARPITALTDDIGRFFGVEFFKLIRQIV